MPTGAARAVMTRSAGIIAPFDPASIMQLWADTSLGPITYGTSPAVATIGNRGTGGGTNDLTQANAAYQGDLNRTINSLDALDVAGDVYFAGLNNTTQGSFFFGLQFDAVTTALLARTGANTETQAGYSFRTNSGGYLQWLASDGTARNQGNSSPGTILSDIPYILESHWNGAEDVVTGINGALTSYAVGRSPGGSNSISFFAVDATGGSAVNGAVLLVGFNPTRLAVDDRTAVRTYMAARMGITL